MTLPNKITVARILLIPVFVFCAIRYSEGLTNGPGDLRWRIAALVIYALAALSDAVDGFIARHYDLSSHLGRVLDPVADKLLLLAGVVTLSVTHWPLQLPLWFAVLVIGRDVLIVIGVLLLHYGRGHVEMGPCLSSKICTVLQLSVVCWVLLDFWSTSGRPWILEILIALAACFTLISAYQYGAEAIRQWRRPSPI